MCGNYCKIEMLNIHRTFSAYEYLISIVSTFDYKVKFYCRYHFANAVLCAHVQSVIKKHFLISAYRRIRLS